jgi:hypothetical protein
MMMMMMMMMMMTKHCGGRSRVRRGQGSRPASEADSVKRLHGIDNGGCGYPQRVRGAASRLSAQPRARLSSSSGRARRRGRRRRRTRRGEFLRLHLSTTCMHTKAALHSRHRRCPLPPISSVSASLVLGPATHRPSKFPNGARCLMLTSAPSPAGGVRRTDRRSFGLHAQPAIAAADVRAEATYPGPLRNPVTVLLIQAA